jgi:CubicO group peptidase (beta-lactamase class C family)
VRKPDDGGSDSGYGRRVPYDGILPGTAHALQHRLARAQRDGRVPSVVAAVARRGQPVWFGAAGVVDGAAPGQDTQYRIGSITKTMVAVGVLRLVEQGAVRLEDPIGEHLPDAPLPDATIYQLLSHTSGAAAETPPPWWERTAGTLRPSLPEILPDPPRRHPAGRVFHYSNPGFGLLGALVTAKSGRPWPDVLADELWAPLGMTRTGYAPTPPSASGWAVHPWADVLLPEPAHDHDLLAPAGQLWATPSDLCRFGVWLAGDGGGVLTRDTVALMRTPAVAPADAAWSGSYGLGVQILRFGERVLVGHTGSMPGFVAIVGASIEDGVTVAVQANAWSQLALGALAGDLAAIVCDREPTLPEPWAPATSVPADAMELIGPWYWGPVAISLTLRADGRLYLAPILEGGRAATFSSTEDGRWLGLDGYYHGEFLEPRRDAQGRLTHLELCSYVLTRKPYDPPEVIPGGLDLGDWAT